MARTFSLLMLFTTLWTVFYLLGYSSATLEGKIFWLRIKYIPSVITPLLWLYFSLEFTQSTRWLRNRTLRVILSIYVLITWLVVFSSDGHGMMWQEVWIEAGEPEELVTHGFYFWVYLAVTYLALFASFVVYARFYTRVASIYKKQALTMMLGSAFPVAASVLFLFFNLDFIPHLDESILFFLLAEVLFGWSLFGYRSFELIPVANEIIIRNMTIGVLVFDQHNKIIEVNPMAQKLLNIRENQVVGKPALQIFGDKDDIFVINDLQSEVETEIESHDFEEVRYFSIHQSPIYNQKRTFLGRVLLITDITERKKHENMLRNFATYDEMTSVFNRRHFFTLAEKELLRAKRYNRSITVVLFDIDNFKHFNDIFGHFLGDSVITHVAQTIKKVLRDSDLFARYGGDEFIILFPEISKECSIKAVNRLREIISKSIYHEGNQEFPVTLSYGIAHWDAIDDQNLEQIIHHADLALLNAKKQGRDMYKIWPLESSAAD